MARTKAAGTEPEEVTQPADNTTSTGAVPSPSAITVTQGYLNDPIVVTHRIPEPVTVTASFLSEAQRKVVVAKHQAVLGGLSEVAEAKAEPASEKE
ncbi:MAG: hypothetical protein ACTHKE_04335 [Sphingomicrobium sp.]